MIMYNRRYMRILLVEDYEPIRKSVELTAREYALLEFLALRDGQVVSRTQIFDHVYDFASERNSKVIDVHVGYLRRKLEGDGRPRLIRTRRGVGYMLGELP